jgi:hypothetical protein
MCQENRECVYFCVNFPCNIIFLGGVIPWLNIYADCVCIQIKAVLIHSYTERDDAVLDLACGKVRTTLTFQLLSCEILSWMPKHFCDGPILGQCQVLDLDRFATTFLEAHCVTCKKLSSSTWNHQSSEFQGLECSYDIPSWLHVNR